MRFFKNIFSFFKPGQDASSTLARLEDRLGHTFKDISLLKLALSHRSYVHSRGNSTAEYSNERLEFLGDAVLDLVITEYLYRQYPGKREGKLSKMKALVVSSRVLKICAREWEIGNFIFLSKAEKRSGGANRSSILADVYEAVLGAVYLDGGLEPAVKLIHSSLVPIMEDVLNDEKYANYKSNLLEYSQSKGLGIPEYQVIDEWGPEHDKQFKIGVHIQNTEWGHGSGGTKKAAEQVAARMALESRGAIINEDN
ncbi:MAG: ribonuclease III [Fibrobacteria bacterium]|nr:ribonuclease III [Fibrobacteria bacterium]